ncbi:TonB-dependent receptor [Granulicella sp. S156]|uniref:TonB-dependent receptor n=1 Tax=Granulicella sp. S156 TaxID=1747224 RepID=UPI00131C30D4|nr:TonB-dependent receptor [Granulicella sp. S156]
MASSRHNHHRAQQHTSTQPKFRLGKTLVVLFSLVCLLTFGVPALRAQVQNGTITGTVIDPAGAVIPDANITLAGKATGLVLHAQSSKEGIYTFPQLIPGDYTVTVERKGFQKATTTITLTVGQTADLNIPLSLGSETQTITVNAEAAANLDSETSNLDYTVQSKQVDDLPLNGRNPYGLATLAPGIMPGTSFGVGVAVARGAVVAAATNNFESNGGIGGSNEILLDGVSIVVCCQGQPAVTPSVEFVNQFKVVTNNPPAQYGRTSGAVLNIASKTGTNALHGDVYDFLRNDKLDAAPYFTKRSGVYPYPGHNDFRTPHRENQFGVLVTGPVFIPKLYNGKDRTFFTFNYEGIRNFAPTAGLTTVPTALMRQGIFTEGTSIYDPNSSNSTTQARTPIPAATCNGAAYSAGKCIPTSTWDPVATAYLQFVPNPNLPGLTNNLSYVSGSSDTANQYNFRVDQTIGARHRLFIRGTKDNDTHTAADLFNNYAGPNGWKQPLGAYLFAIGDVFTVNPNTVLQVTYGFASQTNLQIGNNFLNFDSANYGFSSNFASEQQIVGIPLASFTSLGGAQVGYQSSFNHWSHYVHSLNGTLLLQKGKHALTIGYNGKFILENQLGEGDGVGNPTFGTNFTGPVSPNGAVTGAQQPFASWATFLLGYPTSGSIARQTLPAFNQWWNGLYFQDDWKFLPNLTLNLGVRYDLETGFQERHNNWADFSPTIANPLGVSGGALFLGANGNPNRTWAMSTNEWSPRLGFSYAATPKTVVRGGFGILFLPTSERGYSDPNIGYSQTTNLPTTATGYEPAAMTENFLPNGVLLPAGPVAGTGVSNGTSISGLEYRNPPSYQEQWNLGVEEALGNTFTLEINYAGGHGVHLPLNERPNDLQPQYFGPVGSPTTTSPYYNPATAAAITALQAQVANPYYGKVGVATGVLTNATVQQVQLDAKFPQYTSGAISGIQNGSVGISYQDIGSSNYNALQATVLIHRPGGVSGSVSYVWSKLLGTVSDLTNGFLNSSGNPSVQDFYFLNNEYSVLATDVRHRIVGTATWDLPVGHSKRFGGNMPGWANEIVGGWELTTLVDVYSGLPLSPTVTGTTAFAGTRPMIVPGVNPQTKGGYNHRLGGTVYGQTQGYLNPAAFAVPLSFQLGNMPRSWDKIRGPINFDDNASLIKQFPIHGQFGMEFRVEAFNVFNMVEFGLPNAQFNSSTFGQITTQANLPRNVQLALKVHF